MQRTPRKEVFRTKAYDVHIIGARPPGFRDAYHGMLVLPWWAAAAIVTATWLAANAGFAGLYVWTGGLGNARAGSFADAFFFSVQTMGTIGYGAISPVGAGANSLVVVECIFGLAFNAVVTGLVFVRFSLQRARMLFSKQACVSPMDGVPTLMMRIGNERRSRIIDAKFRLSLTRTTKTAEGVTIYRTVDLPLVRDHGTALSRAWTVIHPMAPGSPLDGATAESLATTEAELTLLVTGVDDTTLQPVHAMHTWMASDVVFGQRLADIVSDLPDGNVQVDLRKFHDLVPAA